MNELERQHREAKLAEVAEKLGVGAANALRDHLSIVDERFYLWLAGLYVPRKCVCGAKDGQGNSVCLHKKDENGKKLCTGGGFYYSNSAKDTDGFEIDIESTAQGINFIHASGMTSLPDGGHMSYVEALPKQIRNDIAAYAQSLQDPEDGYFYHPQWGKDISVSRKGRDLMWVTTMLNGMNEAPLYDTASGLKGTLGAPGKAPEEEGSKSFVGWPDHLKTVEAFREYMAGLDLENRSYPTGNLLAAQSLQIVGREREGIENGELIDTDGDLIADNGFIAAFRDFFDSAQNPENGLWQKDISYSSVSGLMKISLVYTGLGLKMNHYDAAFRSAVKVLMLEPDEADERTSYANGSVYVYNPWVCVSNLISNAKKFGDTEAVERMRGYVVKNAEAMIRVTTRKNLKFKKEDGSFGYTWSYSPSKSQGAPVAVPNTVEGDINGGTIAIRGVWSNMCSALGVSLPIFYRSDLEKFIAAMMEKKD